MKFMYDNDINSNTYGRLVILGNENGNTMLIHINGYEGLFLQSFNDLLKKLKNKESTYVDVIEYNNKIIEICLKINELSFALCHDDDLCEITLKFNDSNDIIDDLNNIIKKISRI